MNRIERRLSHLERQADLAASRKRERLVVLYDPREGITPELRAAHPNARFFIPHNGRQSMEGAGHE